MNYAKVLPGVATIIVVLAILYFSYLVLKPFLFILLVALILAVFLNPVYEWLFKRLKYQSLSAALTLVLLVIFILAPISFILGSVVAEAKGVLQLLQENPTFFNDTQNFIIQQAQSYGLPTDIEELGFQNEAVGFVKIGAQNIAGSLLTVGSVFLDLFLVLITTYFFLTSKKRIAQYIHGIEVISAAHFEKIQTRTFELINGIVRGNLFVIVVQMLVGTIGFLIFGLPAPILLGLLYGILSLVPAVGALLISVPTGIAVYVLYGPIPTIFFASFFILTNILVDNIIAPKIIGKQTKLHQLLIMFSVVGGIQQFGFIGIILGPVVVALAFVAIDIYRELIRP